MESAEHDFGRALSVDAEAVGRPGQRRFRLLVRSASSSIGVWMEKEQLAGIGTWFEETLQRLDRDKPSSEPDVEPLPFPAEPDSELRAGQIGLGYDEGEASFTVHAFEAGGAAGRRAPAFRCLLSRGQCRVLVRKIAEVIAGGRKVCPLCGMPMEPEGHVCARSNGHHP